jgi:parvulin-like peptidyl-prolyl isomerase
MTSPASPQPSSGQSKRATWLLALGATAGLALAAWGLLGDAASARLPEGSVARVNGTDLRLDDFERLVAAVIKDMRTPDVERARKRVLDRMIEEELLIQRALDLGLVHLDRKVRAELTSSVIASVVNDVAGQVASPRDLEEFYDENKEYFTRPGRLRARRLYFRDAGAPGSALVRAESALARLANGDAYETVRAELGDSEISPIPNAMLPATKLREYVGPTLLRTIDSLEVGQWSKPSVSGSAVSLVQLVDREDAVTPVLAEIRDQVEVDWRRRLGDTALRDYLDELRDRAKVEIAEGFE